MAKTNCPNIGSFPIVRTTDRDVHSLIEIPDDENHLSALMRLKAADESMGRIVDSLGGETIALVTTKQLSDSLFRGGHV